MYGFQTLEFLYLQKIFDFHSLPLKSKRGYARLVLTTEIENFGMIYDIKRFFMFHLNG